MLNIFGALATRMTYSLIPCLRLSSKSECLSSHFHQTRGHATGKVEIRLESTNHPRFTWHIYDSLRQALIEKEIESFSIREDVRNFILKWITCTYMRFSYVTHYTESQNSLLKLGWVVWRHSYYDLKYSICGRVTDIDGEWGIDEASSNIALVICDHFRTNDFGKGITPSFLQIFVPY